LRPLKKSSPQERKVQPFRFVKELCLFFCIIKESNQVGEPDDPTTTIHDIKSLYRNL
jgi:hypothetical protein